MGGTKTHILPKPVSHDEYRCVCGENENLIIKPEFVYCPNCRRYYAQDEENNGYKFESRVCDNYDIEPKDICFGMIKINKYFDPIEVNETECEQRIEKLYSVFIGIGKTKIYLCPTCYKAYLQIYGESVSEGKKNISIMKSRYTRMKKKYTKIAATIQPEVIDDGTETSATADNQSTVSE